MNNVNTVTALLTAEGYAPRMHWAGFAAAVRLAEAVSQTVLSPIRRARFIAEAVEDMAELDYRPFQGLEEWATWLAETAEAERPTPCGSTELWGSLMSDAWFIAAKLAARRAEEQAWQAEAEALGLLKD